MRFLLASIHLHVHRADCLVFFSFFLFRLFFSLLFSSPSPVIKLAGDAHSYYDYHTNSSIITRIGASTNAQSNKGRQSKSIDVAFTHHSLSLSLFVHLCYNFFFSALSLSSLVASSVFNFPHCLAKHISHLCNRPVCVLVVDFLMFSLRPNMSWLRCTFKATSESGEFILLFKKL